MRWMITKRETLDDLIEAAREHNLRANDAEAKNDQLRNGWRDEVSRCHETIAHLRLQKEQLEERAEFAELTVKGQNETIANLWAGNDRLLHMVSDMRRLGFEMPRPTSNEPPDNIGSVADDDRDAVKRDPTLAVRDD